MNTAVGIIERRVNGLGVSEAEVQTQGDDNIIVNIPKGTNAKQAREQVGTTAKLVLPARCSTVRTGGTKPPAAHAEPLRQPGAKGDTGDKAEGDKAEKADAGAKATPARRRATTQGRAVTDALKAADRRRRARPRPASPTRPPRRPRSRRRRGRPRRTAGARRSSSRRSTAPTKKPRATAGEASSPPTPTVACGQNVAASQWKKYVLGPAGSTARTSRRQGRSSTSSAAQLDRHDGLHRQGLRRSSQTITGKLAAEAAAAEPVRASSWTARSSPPRPSTQTLTGGNAEISGSFTQQSAEDLANILSYGALPLTFEEQSVTTVTAALGGEQLQAGLIAGAIGLALVVIYLVAYYRGLSLIAILSLLVSAVLTYTIMALLGPAIGFALNLPAVCGAIVAIGITADSFIVYFERIRDEIREGRTLRPAVERAWPRARRTILVSDFVSFLAAAVLFIVTVGKVQGFAFTLGLTTLLDVVVVFFFTKPLMTLLARRKFFAERPPVVRPRPEAARRQAAAAPRPPSPAAPTDPKEA